MEPLRLMCVLAHPDDETLGLGGTLARYAAEGVKTSLVMATRGERGWPGDPAAHPGHRALGQIRQEELHQAARILGLGYGAFLDYMDGDLAEADPAGITAKLVDLLREIRPQVVVTFGPDGGYGHPDHIAISQFTTAAVVCAADPAYPGAAGEPHRVAKLYYRVWGEAATRRFTAVFGEVHTVAGVALSNVAWPEVAITTRIDTAAHWRTVRDAALCHRSQLPDILPRLTDEQHQSLWQHEEFYRAFSTVNGGRALEDDLFAGLR